MKLAKKKTHTCPEILSLPFYMFANNYGNDNANAISTRKLNYKCLGKCFLWKVASKAEAKAE